MCMVQLCCQGSEFPVGKPPREEDAKTPAMGQKLTLRRAIELVPEAEVDLKLSGPVSHLLPEVEPLPQSMHFAAAVLGLSATSSQRH